MVNQVYSPLLMTMQLTCSAWERPLTLMTAVTGRHTDRVKNMSLGHCSDVVYFFICNKPELKFMYSYNHAEHYAK